MHNTIGRRISTAKFAWHPDNKVFLAEMADLQRDGVNPIGQLFNDSADLGFVLVSMKTNLGLPFYLSDTQRDANGSIRYWEFKPAAYSVERDPSVDGVSVIILNN